MKAYIYLIRGELRAKMYYYLSITLKVGKPNPTAEGSENVNP